MSNISPLERARRRILAARTFLQNHLKYLEAQAHGATNARIEATKDSIEEHEAVLDLIGWEDPDAKL